MHDFWVWPFPAPKAHHTLHTLYLKHEGDFESHAVLLRVFALTFLMLLFAKGVVFEKGIITMSDCR